MVLSIPGIFQPHAIIPQIRKEIVYALAPRTRLVGYMSRDKRTSTTAWKKLAKSLGSSVGSAKRACLVTYRALRKGMKLRRRVCPLCRAELLDDHLHKPKRNNIGE